MAKNNNITKIMVGRRASPSEKKKNNWESIDINNLELPQDTTICMFCGNATIRPDQMNGAAKIIEPHIPSNLRERVNIYSFGYASEPIDSSSHLLSKTYESEAKLLYKKTFEPILFDSKGYMKEKPGIEKAFSKLVLSAHCGGCNFANVIIDEFYNTLLTKYKPQTAEMLINKIQYFAYAPNEMPDHNVNAFIIAPYIDPSYSWAKSLVFAETQKVDVDYPRGVIKKITKSKNSGSIQSTFDSAFSESRAIMFKVGHCVCMIPNQMNKNSRTGDHSIAMIAKFEKKHSDDEFDETRRIASQSTSLFTKGFVSNKAIDAKTLFSIITNELDSNPPASQKAF